MTSDLFIHIERHEKLRDAHATIVQHLKYPETVGVSAAIKARETIDCLRLLMDSTKEHQNATPNNS